MALDYPKRMEQVITVEFPDESKFRERSQTILDPAFRYDFSVAQNGRTLTIRHAYESRQAAVSPSDLAGYLDHLQESRALLDFVVHVPKEDLLPGERTGRTRLPLERFDEVNWPLAWWAIVMLVLSLAGCGWLYFWRPAAKRFRLDRRLEDWAAG